MLLVTTIEVGRHDAGFDLICRRTTGDRRRLGGQCSDGVAGVVVCPRDAS